jgi:hypothetical protein
MPPDWRGVAEILPRAKMIARQNLNRTLSIEIIEL